MNYYRNQILRLKSFIVIILLISLFLSSAVAKDKKAQEKETNLLVKNSKSHVLDIMVKVADWQIASNHYSKFHDLDWTNATFYTGLFDLAQLSGNWSYQEWLKAIGNKYQWQPYFSMYVADDIVVSQMYLSMYKVNGDERMFYPTQARTEWVIKHPSPSNLFYGQGATSFDRWSWCDALFMAPPVYVQMYNITRDDSYLDFMNKEYNATYDLLYDKEEHLFYRDYRYKARREKNGEKVFWGRGNGWVVGGLVKILKDLPRDNKYRDFYVTLFKEMCEKVAGLQDESGYWHASLLDQEAYTNPETSASSFNVYALAYGINSGLLDRETYLPVVEKGWKALEKAVSPDGKLGWVQPVGAAPEAGTKDMTQVYGVGAFLLAGCEVYSMVGKN